MINLGLRILLTGATGYLGSNLLHRLIEVMNCDVVVLYRSSSDFTRIHHLLSRVSLFNIDEHDVSKLFSEREFDMIIHCATDYGRKSVSPLAVVEANLLLPLRLLTLSVEHGVRAFVNTDTLLDKRVSHYSLSKKQFREWLERYSNELVLVNMELCHFYGPGDDKTKFVSMVLHKLLDGVPEIPLTKGEQVRDFAYIADVLDAFELVVTSVKGLRSGFINHQVCEVAHASIRDLVTLMKSLSGNMVTDLKFGALDYRDHEVMTPEGVSASLRELGWSPKYSLLQGLREMIDRESPLA